MGVEGWIHARSVTFTCLDAGQEAVNERVDWRRREHKGSG